MSYLREIETVILNGARDNVVRTVKTPGCWLQKPRNREGVTLCRTAACRSTWLYPKDGSPFVFYCKGGQLFLYEREAWDREGINGNHFAA
jgi:hypothetical protein